MLALAWQYLSGRAVATDPADRQTAEWPPHPDRVFQALVAAWGERGCDPAERAALQWLESLGPPNLAAPDETNGTLVRPQTLPVFVPVNDTQGPARGDYQEGQHLGLLPAHRPRKPRSFPSVLVGDAACALVWPDATAAVEHRSALGTLCAAVTHVGHSRSLVRAWLTDEPPPATWLPDAGGLRRELSLRTPHPGRLAVLERAYADLSAGRLARNEWPSAPWTGYCRRRPAPGASPGPFDPRLVILRKGSGADRPGLVQVPAFVSALRGTLMANAGPRALPLVSGHASGGSPLSRPHVAWLPLAYVGGEHADGHLLGFGMALPRDLAPDDEQAIFEALAAAMDPASGRLDLTAGRLGTMELVQEERPVPPLTLRAPTWTGPAADWATVMPIVLDRLPPHRHGGDDAWAAAQVAAACIKQGLPSPAEICIAPVSAHLGAPTARAFPPLLRKPDGARRWHVHAVLRFATAVEGPLLLGAGRYRGYGLCRPLPPRNALSIG
jgi:CRISPR-associated protein Csb2